jgi:C-terminal binding protein
VRILRHARCEIKDLPDAECAAADALMVQDDFVVAADFERFSRLKVLVRTAVGYDRIDRVAAAKHGVTVCNIPDYGTTEVADFAIALLLSLRRGLLLYHDTQRATPPAPWRPIDGPEVVGRLLGSRLGIVGLGRIGTAVALRAKAFGMDVVCYDRYQPMGQELGVGVRRVHSLEELFEGADAVSLHLPLTPETRDIIGLDLLRRMNPHSVLINTARGAIVDIDAVETALREGHLAGAGLDVMPVDPPVPPLPNLLRAYQAREPWLLGRLIITPHSAFHSARAWDDIRRKAAETAITNLRGTPRNVIDPASY